jgi:Rrf2 family transcriptional regulator, cysteine metabolism repressor
MMFSTKAEYGVRVMAHLAERHGREPVALGTIAAAEGLPLAYLEQLVQRLRRANLVTSRRGARGGYSLARAADTITMAEVVRALEGRIAPIECITSGVDADGEPVCSREATTDRPCPTKLLWTRVQGAIVGTLDDIPLSDLTRPASFDDPKPQRKLTPA